MPKTTQILSAFNMCNLRDFLKIAVITLFLGFNLSNNAELQAQTSNAYGLKKVVIDPGHGGKDPGAVGSFAKEKDIVLAVALKLGNYIQDSFPDVKVIYTRSTDVFVDLHKRSKIANDNKADLFISIHANAIAHGKAHGAETFVMGLDKSEENMRVAKLENSVILKEDDYENNYSGFDPKSPESSIIFSLFQNAYLDQSLILSDKVQKYLTSSAGAGRLDRGVKQAAFLVLWRTTMPSILIECGFITHPDEEKFMSSTDGQDKIAKSIFNAFSEYKLALDKQAQSLINGSFSEVLEENQTENQKNEPEDKISSNNSINFAEGIFFGVQVKTSSKQINIHQDAILKKHENVFEYQQDGLFKYVVGLDKDYEKVSNSLKSLRAEVSDCFIVAFKNGERFSVIQAQKEAKSN